MPAKTSIADETGLAPLEAAGLFVAKLRKPAHILVAISGGSDSTGLLLALHEASIGSGEQVRLSAVTIDHALRPESADEAKKVATLCAGLGIFHAVRRWDDQKPASGLAEASRLARQQLCFREVSSEGALVESTGRCPLAVNGSPVVSARIKPGDAITLRNAMVLLVTKRPAASETRRHARADFPFGDVDAHGLVGESPAAWGLRESLAFAGRSREHVLLLGESGSGKELSARAIHALSARAECSMVSRNAATLPDVTEGQLIDVQMPLQVSKDVLWLPPAAIRTFQTRTFVVLQTPDGPRTVNVTLGLQTTDRVEIKSGLNEGDVVIGE